MSFRPAALIIVAALQCFAAAELAHAQRQKFRIGGGAGFAFPSQPDISLGSTAAVGGFFGIRFTDNVSVETNFTFYRTNRVYAENGVPVDQVQARPAFRFENNRYHLDGIFMLHLGRRQPFHPFLYGGGGLVRRDEKRSDFIYEPDPENPDNPAFDRPVGSEIVLNETSYEPAGLVGGGVDIYFMYNLAARAEFRWWIPQSQEKRDYMFFFAASFYF